MPYLPLELISIIVGFAAEDVNTSEWGRRLELPSLNLSLVSRTWLAASRRELFQHRNFIFKICKPRHIPDFLDILESRDCLPKLPHILSFMSIVTLRLPVECSESTHYPEETFTLLDNFAKRREFFQPKTLSIVGFSYVIKHHNQCFSYPSRLITTIAKTFPTITQLQFNAPDAPNCCSNLHRLLISFEKLQAISVEKWDIVWLTNNAAGSDGSLRIYRFPEGLRTLEYNLRAGIRNDNLQHILDWVQTHPPLCQLRRLSLTNALPNSCTLMQGFINVCPNLDILCIFHRARETMDGPGRGLDLSRHKRLDRLCLYIPEVPDEIVGEIILKIVLLTVQTATSLSGSLEIVAEARHFEEPLFSWWPLLSEVIHSLPRDFVFKLQVVGAPRKELADGKGEDVIRRIFGKLTKRRRVLFHIEEPPALWFFRPSGWDFVEIADKTTWKSLEIEEK